MRGSQCLRRNVEVSRLPRQKEVQTPDRVGLVSYAFRVLVWAGYVRQALVKVNGVVVGILCNYGQVGEYKM